MIDLLPAMWMLLGVIIGYGLSLRIGNVDKDAKAIAEERRQKIIKLYDVIEAQREIELKVREELHELKMNNNAKD